MTLIEVLMVILVIAVLISLLLPAFSRARQVAQLAVCSSNLKQISTATMLYQSNNRGRMPGFLGRRNIAWLGQDGTDSALPKAKDRALNTYLDPSRKGKVGAKCPGDFYYKSLSISAYERRGSSYVANRAGLYPGNNSSPSGMEDTGIGEGTVAGLTYTRSILLDQVQRPGIMVQLMESGAVDRIEDANNAPKNHEFHYNQKWVFGFLDGHVNAYVAQSGVGNTLDYKTQRSLAQ
jgi:type II secretory pathway pseudopilin PulG